MRSRVIWLAALALSLSSVFLVGSASVVRDPVAGARAATSGAAAPVSPGEVPELRTRTSRTFAAGRGSFRVEAHLGSINYQDARGDWLPIENELVASSEQGYERRNKANRFIVDLPRNLSGAPVRVREGSEQLSFKLEGAEGRAAAADGATATYEDALPGVDVAYTALTDGVKEELTLSSAQAQSSFTFAVRTSSSLEARRTEAGGIDFVNAAGRPRFSFLPPSMVDAAGADSTAVTFGLAQVSGGWTVILEADRGWLEDPRRVWPVVVDPTVFPRPSQYTELIGNPDCYIRNGSSANANFCSATVVDTGTDSSGTRRGCSSSTRPASCPPIRRFCTRPYG